MSYAIDLNPRQSARTLEQAVRQQAQVVLEPRVWADHQELLCRIEPPGNPLELDMVPVLVLAVLSRGETLVAPAGPEPPQARPVGLDELRGLIGTYVDAVIWLGEHRYMFSSDLLRVLPAVGAGEPPRVHVTRPVALQVAQRRRFRRINLSHSAQVELTWEREGLGRMGGVAWLCNLSGDGLACRTEQRIADMLWIGDEMNVEFTLAPGDTERFQLRGALCSKTPTGNLGKCILGIQYLADEAHPGTVEAARLLRQRLVERAPQLANTRKGVDF
ncbi:MAG: hypothetical protein HY718_09970 [Planctomycetes bacterium]|nr:hypothetical protein [Planctomycetota bacterium]